MKKILLLILVMAVPLMVFSQGERSSRGGPGKVELSEPSVSKADTAPAFVKTWRLVEDFTTVQDFEFDTLQNTFQIYNPIYRNSISTAYLGNMGLPARNNLYFNEDKQPGFLFLKPYSPYLYTPENTMFYNITKPFTMVEYYGIIGVPKDQKEEIFHAIHTQNINPFLNVGLDIRLISSGGMYLNQTGKFTNFTFFGSRTGKDYTVHSSFHFNGLRNGENGGIRSDSTFMNSNFDSKTYKVNLTDAYSMIRGLDYNITQRYHFGKMQEVEDTTSETGIRKLRDKTAKTGSFIHTFNFERNYRNYSDESSGDNTGFYPTPYWNTQSTFDSTYYHSLSNTFQVMLDENPNRKKDFGARAFITHDWVKYACNVLDSSFIENDTIVKRSRIYQYSNVHVGASALHSVGGSGWSWVIAGKFYPLGYKAGDIELRGEITRMFQGKKGESRIQISGRLSTEEPDHFLRHYESNFYQWHNDFRKVKDIRGALLISNEALSLTARADLSLVSGYMYFNEQALPAQYNPVISIIGFNVDKKFKLGPFHSDHRIVYHLNTNKDVVRIPDLSYYTSDYFSFYLVKNVLRLEIGFDLYYYTKYRGLAYAPSSGMFYAQEIREIGNYPYGNLFLTAKLKRVRFFFRWDHIYAGQIEKNYFHVLHYPIPGNLKRIGLSWTFYD